MALLRGTTATNGESDGTYDLHSWTKQLVLGLNERIRGYTPPCPNILGDRHHALSHRTIDRVAFICLTRTPFQSQVDFEASYQVRMGGARRLTVLADIFNMFNQQIVQGYDTWTSLTFGAGPNSNFGQPTSQILGGPQIQTPRQIRVGLRYAF